MKKILVVCEAGEGNGLGHFYRSLALAQILESDHRVTLLTNGTNLPECGIEVIATDFEAFHRIAAYDLAVLDGYEFPLPLLNALIDNNIPFVEVSDFDKMLYPTKWWINPSIDEQNTPGLGLNYSLLRKEILQEAQNRKFKESSSDTLFIAFGGTDESSYSLKVVQKLLPTQNFKRIGVLYPQSGKDFNKLKALEAEHKELTIFFNLSAAELIKAVDHYGLTLVSSSTIATEMIALRKVVFTCRLYENQRLLHFQMTENKAAIETKLQGLLSKPQSFIKKTRNLPDQQTLFEHQKKLIDGFSEERIRNFIANCFQ